jgi:Peptidase S24-like
VPVTPPSGQTAHPRRGLSVVRVRGRSMQPVLHEGDVLLVRWRPAAARLGALVLVRLPDRPLSVKRLVSFADGGWWVERDNPAEGVDSWQVGAIAPADQAGVVLCRLGPRPRWFAHRLQ